MKIIFLMAGEGRRFMAHSNLPKPLIKLAGAELIKWAAYSYNFIGIYTKWSDVHFITRLDHIKEFGMDKFLKKAFSKEIKVHYVEKTTRGPAETAFLLKEAIAADEQVIVSDCDMFFNSLPLFNEMLKIKNNQQVWGILPYVKREDNQNTWSYAELDKEGRVKRVNEKDIEMFNAGSPGIVGAYTFNRWRYFVDEAEKMIAEGDLSGAQDKKEFYLSGIYRRFLKAGRLIKGVEVYPAWILGTPEQFSAFEDRLKG